MVTRALWWVPLELPSRIHSAEEMPPAVRKAERLKHADHGHSDERSRAEDPIHSHLLKNSVVIRIALSCQTCPR